MGRGMDRRKGAAASGGASQLTIAKNCHKAKLKTQKQTGKEIATNGASKPGTDRAMCGKGAGKRGRYRRPRKRERGEEREWARG